MTKRVSQSRPAALIEKARSLLEGLSLSLRGSGLGFALFLGLMRLAKLPCGPFGGCDAVLASVYGSIAGIPLGFFAVPLWLVALLTSSDRLRRFSLLALALGSLALVFVQALLIRAFCPWCIAHAVFAWLSYPGWRAKGHWSAVLAAALLAGGGHYVHREIVASAAKPAGDIVAFDELSGAGLRWLGRGTASSPVLVLGISCPSCWERWLLPLGTRNWTPQDEAPVVFWKSDPQTRELTEYFVAAVLSAKGGGPESFAAVLSACAPERSLFVTDPASALAFLRRRFPDAGGALAEARSLIAEQNSILSRARCEFSPLYLQRDLPPVTSSSFEEDFPNGKN